MNLYKLHSIYCKVFWPFRKLYNGTNDWLWFYAHYVYGNGPRPTYQFGPWWKEWFNSVRDYHGEF